MLLPSFEAVRLLVVGDVMLDTYWHGETSRISPEAPVPVVHVREVEHRPGGAANVAVNAASLGATPILVGVAGEDEAGAMLARLLDDRGVIHRLVHRAGVATVTKMRVMSRHQQLIRLDIEGGFEHTAGADLLAALREHLADVDAVVLSDYAKGTLADPRALIETARAAGTPVVVDPKESDFARYRGATAVTPNLAEFESVAGRATDDDDLADRAERLRARLDLEALLVTRGEHGMSLVTRSGGAAHVGAHALEVFDVTGAGDTVIATFAAAIAAGVEMRAAMRWANLAAGVVVGRLGAASVTPAELARAAHAETPLPRGVLDREAFLAAVRAARAAGETVVMTNGCFDLLHAGHVACLERARGFGDHLAVAVNDDASVRRLKGEGRPVTPLDRRMAVVAALSCVDWVVPFPEETPRALIEAALPDVLVKGGDYAPGSVAGGDAVRANGGRVEIVEYVEGCSSSEMLEALARGRAGGRVS